jgi:hypothetical protein
VKKLRGAHLIEFRSEDQQQRALMFKNITLGQDRLTLIPIRARRTTEDVFNYMAKQLRIEQESKLLLEATTSNKEGKSRAEGWQREVKKVDFKENHGFSPTCWTCRSAGRPYEHAWRTCKWRSDSPSKKGSLDSTKDDFDDGEFRFVKGGKGKGGKGGHGRGWSQ